MVLTEKYKSDIAVANAMVDYGSSFVSALGNALLHADPDNIRKIKYAFPDYWRTYSKIADQARIGE